MSRRNEALRSVHVRTIFAVIAAAFFPHSGSVLSRLATSSKNAFVKYCTMDAAFAAAKRRQTGKSLGWCPWVAFETGKVLRTAVSARPRVGSQARSKARDSRSLPEGVPRFESWPTHHQLAPTCGREMANRGCVSSRASRLLTFDREPAGPPVDGNDFIKQ